MIKPIRQHAANKTPTTYGLFPDIFNTTALNARLPNCASPITPDAAPAACRCDEIANVLPNGNKKPLPKVRTEMVIKLVANGHGLIYICKANNMPPL